SIWIFSDSVNKWSITGAGFCLIGVFITVLIHPLADKTIPIGMGITIGKGAFLTVIAAFVKVLSNLIDQTSTQEIPIEIVSIFKMFIGVIFFFGITIILYGPEHFIDVSSRFLWQWMLFYAAIIIVLGQFLWFNGLQQSTVSEVSLITSFSPILGILEAFLLLNEVPTIGQYLGGTLILGGIILNQIGAQQRLKLVPCARRPSDREMSKSGGFKGI
ncbi:MAG: DMT family transporter, partial [Cyanobacteria bacterium J06636_28]